MKEVPGAVVIPSLAPMREMPDFNPAAPLPIGWYFEKKMPQSAATIFPEKRGHSFKPRRRRCFGGISRFPAVRMNRARTHAVPVD